MAHADGPHTRNATPGLVFRGSKKRVAKLSRFERLPAEFWLVMAIAAVMLAVCAFLIDSAP
jgi:hypothetical protein